MAWMDTVSKYPEASMMESKISEKALLESGSRETLRPCVIWRHIGKLRASSRHRSGSSRGWDICCSQRSMADSMPWMALLARANANRNWVSSLKSLCWLVEAPELSLRELLSSQWGGTGIYDVFRNAIALDPTLIESIAHSPPAPVIAFQDKRDISSVL